MSNTFYATLISVIGVITGIIAITLVLSGCVTSKSQGIGKCVGAGCNEDAWYVVHKWGPNTPAHPAPLCPDCFKHNNEF